MSKENEKTTAENPIVEESVSLTADLPSDEKTAEHAAVDQAEIIQEDSLLAGSTPTKEYDHLPKDVDGDDYDEALIEFEDDKKEDKTTQVPTEIIEMLRSGSISDNIDQDKNTDTEKNVDNDTVRSSENLKKLNLPVDDFNQSEKTPMSDETASDIIVDDICQGRAFDIEIISKNNIKKEIVSKIADRINKGASVDISLIKNSELLQIMADSIVSHIFKGNRVDLRSLNSEELYQQISDGLKSIIDDIETVLDMDSDHLEIVTDEYHLIQKLLGKDNE